LVPLESEKEADLKPPSRAAVLNYWLEYCDVAGHLGSFVFCFFFHVVIRKKLLLPIYPSHEQKMALFRRPFSTLKSAATWMRTSPGMTTHSNGWRPWIAATQT
jgi:hypothetical protein